MSLPDDPLILSFWVCAISAAACWVLSIVTKEYSWVDRIWSIAPVVYVLIFAGYAGLENTRLNIMAALTLLWGVRLTYNFARKGGYRPGGEDYRWIEVKKKIGSVGFQLLNITFIAPFQNILLLWIALPAFIAHQHLNTPLTLFDLVATLAFFVLFVGETIADSQQWRFQTDKHAKRRRGANVDEEFITTGLFRYSRHPNFFCEQGMWWSFYLFSVGAGGAFFNWTIGGAALLTLLFQGSTTITERITLSKYPNYAAYQQTTSRLLPLPPKNV